MDMEEFFYIYGNKVLIFRREGEFYITFNPEELQFYKINIIGAEILYLISKEYTYKSLIKYFTEKYSLSEELFKKDFVSFLTSFGCKNVIKNNLIALGMEV